MLPSVPWTDIVPASTAVQLLEFPIPIDGNLPRRDLEVLCRLVKHAQPKRLFEIGTFEGRTTVNFAAHAPIDAHIYTLDLPPTGADKAELPLEVYDRKYIEKPVSGAFFRGTRHEARITQLYGDSAQFDFTPYEGAMDFVFVDGSHSYHYVLHDSWTALRLLRKRGFLVWHDYEPGQNCCWPGVASALEELQSRHADFRGIKHIQGSAIAVLPFRVPLRVQWFPRFAAEWRAKRKYVRVGRDSRETTGLLADLRVHVSRHKVEPGAPIEVEVVARNAGFADWLSHRALLGPVRVGCHLLDAKGELLDLDYARLHWSAASQDVTMPGETRSLVASVPAPPPGRYLLEFDLVAEEVCWFARNGSATVRIPMEVS